MDTYDTTGYIISTAFSIYPKIFTIFGDGVCSVLMPTRLIYKSGDTEHEGKRVSLSSSGMRGCRKYLILVYELLNMSNAMG